MGFFSDLKKTIFDKPIELAESTVKGSRRAVKGTVDLLKDNPFLLAGAAYPTLLGPTAIAESFRSSGLDVPDGGNFNADEALQVDSDAFELPPLDFSSIEGFAREAAEFNRGLLRENITEAFDRGTELTRTLNRFNLGEFQTNLASINPRAVELQVERDNQILSFLRGEISEDVGQNIAFRSAERAQIAGLGPTSGGAARNIEARDLGLQSLDLIQRGISASSGVLESDRRLAASLLQDPTSISSGILGFLNQASLVPASTLLGAGQSSQFTQSGLNTTLALTDLQKEISLLELEIGQQQAAEARAIAEQQQRADLIGGVLGFAGLAIGGLAGGPPGAAVGAGVGQAAGSAISSPISQPIFV